MKNLLSVYYAYRYLLFNKHLTRYGKLFLAEYLDGELRRSSILFKYALYPLVYYYKKKR